MNKSLWIAILTLIIGAGVGYIYGSKIGYDKGQQDAAAAKANPFAQTQDQPSNPLGNIQVNPFK